VRIWVDADACPSAIKTILFRAAERARVELILVANRKLATPPSKFIRSVRVPDGFDVADRWIVEHVAQRDLVVTADVPLAADIVAKSALALNPRGELYTEDNVGECLAMRDLADELRSTGVPTAGPASFGKRDRQAFAKQLDRILARRERTDFGAPP
jgi:uncharacterized protein YaiI (UPF0178 family)